MTLRDRIHAAAFFELLDYGLPSRHAEAVAEAIADRLRAPGPTIPAVAIEAEATEIAARTDPTLIDLRAEQDYEYPGGRRKVRKRRGQPVRRDPSQVTGIVLHQTAVEYGVSQRQIDASGGDERLALARRGLDVACHAIAFRAGFYVAAHDLAVHVNHGNGLNATTLGLEVDGRYPGLMDDPETAPREDLRTTWGGDPTVLTDATVETARAALAWLVEEGRREGMPIRYVYAHRQSSDTRRSDPGEELWRRVVLDYAVPELGLETQPARTWGRGEPVPLEWAPAGVGRY